MLFTAYFDESDTHDQALLMTMAAFLGHARQWEIFSRRLRELQARPPGFSVLHATDFRSGSGEFKRWTQPQKNALVKDIVRLVRTELEKSFVINLSYDRYQNEYRKSPTPKGVNLDSQYGVCFRNILNQIINTLFLTRKRHKLHLVIERGHRNVLDAERIFNEAKETTKARGFELLGSFIIATKDSAPPLMAADFLAHFYAIISRLGGMGLEGYAAATKEPPRGQAGITFLDFRPGALEGQKQIQREERFDRQKVKRRARFSASPPEEQSS